jgi:hypothetical protein
MNCYACKIDENGICEPCYLKDKDLEGDDE